MKKEWLSTQVLPVVGEKVYFWCNNPVNFSMKLMIGTYTYQEYRYGGPELFLNKFGVFDLDMVSHWMPYIEEESEILPLPPNYPS